MSSFSNEQAMNGQAIGFLQHRAGDRLKGRYEVLSHLGGGAFGSVYRVRDVAVGVDLACKEMHVLDDPSTSIDERAAALQLFKREALNLATVRHPHIPSAYFEQEDGAWQICPRCGLDWPDARFCPTHGAPLLPIAERYYLMMDFVDGPTLEELVVAAMQGQGRPLDEAQCVGWMAQIAVALRALHRVGIIHRDIKPDNIKIRTQDNAAVLLDFGLTRKAEEAGGYGTFRQRGTGHLGTPGYAPPDVRELARPEARADIYALGMTLYRLLAGRDPQEPAGLEAMLSHPPRFFNASISPAIEALIVRATRPIAEERFASIDELLFELEPLGDSPLSGAKTTAPPFVFPDGARVRNGEELARLLDERGPSAAPLIFDGSLAQWLEAIGQNASAKTAINAAARFPDHPARAVESLRRAVGVRGAKSLQLQPSRVDFGAVDSGATATLALRLRAHTPGLSWGRILALPNDDAASSSTAPPTPFAGIIVESEWEGNDITIEVVLDSSRLSNGDYSGLLIFVDGEDDQSVLARVPIAFEVRPLTLRTEPAELDFGTIAVGEIATRFVRVVSAQSTLGRPRGAFYVPPELGPLATPARFEGDEPFKITLDGTRSSSVARRYEGVLRIDTNGGRLRMPVRFSLSLTPLRVLSIVSGCCLLGAISAGLFRFSYAIVNPDYATRWLVENGAIVAPRVAGYGAPFLLGALGGAFFELWRWTNDASLADDANTAAGLPRGWRGSTLRLSPLLQGLLLSGVLGALLCWPLIWIGHWAAWGVGDWLLRPLQGAWQMPLRAVGVVPERAAPWAWAQCGALVGTIGGAARIGALLGRPAARYAAWLVLGVALLVTFINAAIFVGG